MIRVFLKTLLSVVLALGAVFCAQSQTPFSRNIEKSVFVPKGQWIVGLSANYGQSKFDNYQFLVVENINGDDYSFKVSPMLCYMFKDDMGIGGRFSYDRNRTKLTSADVVLSSEDSFDIDNLYLITQNYHSTIMFRNYISIGKSKRFGIVADVAAKYGISQSKLASGTGTDFTGTFMHTNSISLGVSPGVVAFLNNYTALEVNVGVLEAGYSKSKQTTDQIYIANTTSKNAAFKINLFSISLGVSFYL